jgi:hypothetical protein
MFAADPSYSPFAPSNVEELLAGLGPNELAFFTAVDQELDKVNNHYQGDSTSLTVIVWLG